MYSKPPLENNSFARGTEPDPRTNVQRVIRLLEDYASGFAFLKELIQNADDAKATEMAISWHPGLGSNAPHALLKGPGLLIVNNGPFSEANAKAICSLGLGTSGTDSEKIGRFGLGIKSVFHVCEAFFFLESTRTPSLCSLYSPWLPDFHKEWDNNDISWSVVRDQLADEIDAYIRQIEVKWDRWFGLWVPLRKESHCEGIGAIRKDKDAFPGDHRNCPESLSEIFKGNAPRVEETLLLLKRLHRVIFTDGQRERSVFRKPSGESGEELAMHTYSANVNKGAAEEWREKEKWPQVFKTERVSEREPDKAVWDASVIVTFFRGQGQQGKLRVFWNVALPVGNEPAIDLEIPGMKLDVHLFLHGCFFLNESRTKVYGVDDGFRLASDDSETGIRVAWNRSLAYDSSGLLVKLIPALADSFEGEGLAPETIGIIVFELQNTELFQTHRTAICQQRQYLKVFTEDRWRWACLPYDNSVFVLPIPKWLELAETEVALESLIQDESQSLYAFEGQPSLSREPITVSWNAEDFEQLASEIDIRPYTPAERAILQSCICSSHFPIETLAAWSHHPIFEVRRVGTGEIKGVSIIELDEMISNNALFEGSDEQLERAVTKACARIDAWCQVSPIPLKYHLRSINAENICLLLLRHSELNNPEQRIDLIKILINSGTGSSSRRAARYMLHGCFPSRSDDQSTLYFGDSDWAPALKPLLEHIDRSWALVPHIFAAELSLHEKTRLSVKDCSSYTFRELCRTPQFTPFPQSLDLSESASFLLRQLNDIDLLRSLPIHKLGNGTYASVEDGLWLEPQLNPVQYRIDLWDKLARNARIVNRDPDPQIAILQENAFSGRILNKNGIMKLCSEQQEVSEYAELILECLDQGTPERETSAALRACAWLPTKEEGTSCRVDQIIWLKDAEPQVEHLLEALPKQLKYFGISSLALDLKDERWSRAWSTMVTPASNLIPVSQRFVELCHELVQHCPSIATGLSWSGEEMLKDWCVASSRTSSNLCPAAGLIQFLYSRFQNNSQERWRIDACQQFFTAWPESSPDKYEAAFRSLRIAHENTSTNEQINIARVFHRYLSHVYKVGLWGQFFVKKRDFYLLNKNGKWCPITELAFPLPGVSRSALVDEEAAKALGHQGIEEALDFTAGDNHKEAVEDDGLMQVLDEYALSFEERLKRQHWGLLLCLMGNCTRSLAKDYLESEARVESYRTDLAGPRLKSYSTHDHPRVRLVRAQYACEIFSGRMFELHSLFGSRFEASSEEFPESLLIPLSQENGENRHFIFDNNNPVIRVRFRLIHADLIKHLTAQQVRQCLIKTIQILQKEVLAAPEDRTAAVASLFETVESMEDFSLSTAQRCILGAARIQLTQIGYRPEPGTLLFEALQELEEADQLRAAGQDEQSRGNPDAKATLEASNACEQTAVSKLRSALTKDVEIQEATAAALARRIEQEQYSADSIPFELFQNADDAYLELGESFSTTPSFSFLQNEDRFFFIHQGRPINASSSGDTTEKSRQKQDLVRMLTLHGSDKYHDRDRIPTGQFGLGFKSVFLVTRSPQVRSGRLAFEILGGFYPRELKAAAKQEIDGWLQDNGFQSERCTLVSFKASVGEQPPTFHHRFIQLAPFLPVFAKAIREIRLDGQRLNWFPETLIDSEELMVEKGHIEVDGETINLLAATSESLRWVFAIDGDKLKPLPEVPCLWITAPTRESTKLGFALNGPFTPDPGRSRLTSSTEGRASNVKLLEKAALLLCRFLRWKLEHSGDKEAFAHSAWRLFASPKYDSDSLDGRDQMLSAIWKHGSGYHAFIESEDCLPNGLSDQLFCLTDLSSIQFRLEGFLSSKQALPLLARMLSAQNLSTIRPETLVTETVASYLSARNALNHEIQPLDLADLTEQWLEKEKEASPTLATDLGAYLSERALFSSNTDDRYDWPEAEKNKLINTLCEVRFLNKENNWLPASALVTTVSNSSEAIRSQLAPPEIRLHPDYEDKKEATDFFKLCRGDHELSAQLLAYWITSAIESSNSERKEAVINFLDSEDPLLGSTTRQLEDRIQELIIELAEFTRRSQKTQNRIRNALTLGKVSKAREQGEFFIGSSGPGIEHLEEETTFAASKTITADEIQKYWNREEALQNFSLSGRWGKLVLPVGNEKAITKALVAPRSTEGKACWLRALCLGCSLSLPLGRNGLTRIEDFWSKELGHEFWVRITQASEISDTRDNIFTREIDNIFKEVISRAFKDQDASGENAHFWRRVFYDFRKMHHYVYHNDLPEILLELAELEADGSGLINFLRSGKIPDAQAAETTRFQGVIGESMKIGLLFLMRELRRLGVFKNPAVDPACFYLNAPAREVVNQLGWVENFGSLNYSGLVQMSEAVHEKMCIELPDLKDYFDIPLQLYALNSRTG